MCGIAGYISYAGDAESKADILRRMCGLMSHRGPDGEGLHFDGQAGLGHRRLSIIDLSGGKQPMGNPEGTVWVTFNGEIYNFPELRADLEARGFRFRTRSDTEVILHGYQAFGTGILDKLNGMFAFAVWDSPNRRLLLARDRMGKKPLYYAQRPEGFLFASELKALLADPALPRETDPAAVDQFFTLGYVPAPRTILKGVSKLRPGHFLVLEDGRAKVDQYWDVRYSGEEGARKEEDYVDELESLLQAAVKRRLISDVPLGAFLSGGLDSSVVVGIISRLAQGSPVKTFTIGFKEQGFSELEDARRIAAVFKTDHREFTVQPDAMAVLPDLVWHLDEPFGDSSALPTYYVSRMARQEVTVALSGDGGDELFAGYHSYGLRSRYDRYRAIPPALRRLCGPLGRMLPVAAPGRSLLIGLGELEKHMSGEQVCLYPLIKDRIWSRSFAERLAGSDPLDCYAYWRNVPEGRLSRMQYLDTKVYLAEDILTKVDRMSMAVSLETRAPLLDYTLAEFAALLPPSLQRKDGRGKYVLRRLAGRLLPPEALAKRKQGFSIPREQWFRKEMKAWTGELLGSARSRDRGYFRPGVVDQILRAHAGGRDFSFWLWCLLVFEIWHRAYIDADTRRV